MCINYQYIADRRTRIIVYSVSPPPTNTLPPEPEMPIITIPLLDTTVFIGGQVSLTCVATGDPRPQLYVLKDGVPQDTRIAFFNDGGFFSNYSEILEYSIRHRTL